jgi:hypothetical protein
MKARTRINFSERYYKLDREVFPTVRGKIWFSDIKRGQVFEITVKDRYFCHARVKSKIVVKLGELSLGFLRTDGNYDGFRVRRREDYLELLNRFRRFHPADWSTWVTVIHLEKVEKTTRIYTFTE